MEIDGRSFDYEPVKPSRINRRAREQASSVSELPQSQPDLLTESSGLVKGHWTARDRVGDPKARAAYLED